MTGAWESVGGIESVYQRFSEPAPWVAVSLREKCSVMQDAVVHVGVQRPLDDDRIGVVLAFYGGFRLLARPLPVSARTERRPSLVIGLTTGVIIGGPEPSSLQPFRIFKHLGGARQRRSGSPMKCVQPAHKWCW
jgi:hypothetical protein